MLMTDEEIRMSWNNCEDPRNHVGILADFNLVSESEMEIKLLDLGLIWRERGKIRYPLFNPWTEKRIRRLYDQGRADFEIARIVSAPEYRIQTWRARNHLPKNRAPEKVELPEAILRELYDMGLCDVDIAEETKIQRREILKWRKRNGLPGHKIKFGDRIKELGKRGKL